MHKEMSTNNRYGFKAVFLIFPGFFLKKLYQLFPTVSKEIKGEIKCED